MKPEDFNLLFVHHGLWLVEFGVACTGHFLIRRTVIRRGVKFAEYWDERGGGQWSVRGTAYTDVRAAVAQGVRIVTEGIASDTGGPVFPGVPPRPQPPAPPRPKDASEPSGYAIEGTYVGPGTYASVLDSLVDNRVVRISREEGGTFRLMELCDEFYSVRLDPEQLAALGRELIEMAVTATKQ
jgi:hypothetical protein